MSASAEHAAADPRAPEMSLADMASALVVDRDEQLATRAAWLYFVSGLTQAQIAKSLGLSRIRVNRLLAEAREQGLVQIRIAGRLADCVACEVRLKQRFGLDEAIVVPTPPDQSLVPHVIGTAAGAALAQRLADGMSVGVGWGRTLRMSLRSVPRRPLPKLSVVSLLGGLTRGSAMNPHETASHLADLLDAQCYYIAAPALTDTEAARDLLVAQPMLHEVFEKGRKVDLAFLSVGELGLASTMTRVGLIGKEEVLSLREAGAVGDLCAHWIDAQGRIVDHPMNRRCIGLSPSHLRDIPCVMLASGGMAKIGAIHGALAGGMVDVLIVDEKAAEGVLALAERPAP